MTTAAVAGRFEVAGYVQNREDGSVLLVAEGSEPELMRFLDAVRTSAVARFVRHESVNWSTAAGEFDTFDIRYG